jgi:hypothetical protein
MRALRVIFGYVLYAAASLAACLSMVELYLRHDDEAYLRLYYWNYDPPMYAPSEIIPYTLRPNVDSPHFRRGEFAVHVRTNAQGLREDREIAIPKPKDTYRVLVIGDSFAFGYGVERNETFEAVAEAALQSSHPGQTIEVVDMGFAAAGSLDARYVFMREVAPLYQADAVIVVFFYGADLGRLYENRPYSTYDQNGLPIVVRYEPIVIDANTGFRTGRLEFETQKAGEIFFPSIYPPSTYGSALPRADMGDILNAAKSLVTRLDVASACRVSRLCQVVQKFVEIRRLTDRNTGLYQAQLVLLPREPQTVGTFLLDEPGTAPDGLPLANSDGFSVARAGWEMAQRIFTGMRDLTADHGTKFGVMFVPSPILVDFDPRNGQADRLAKFFRVDQMEAAQKLNKPDHLFGTWLKQAGIPYLDPALPMRADREREAHPLYFEYDQHWNAAGHASLGRHLAQWIEDQGWLSQSKIGIQARCRSTNLQC